MRAVSLHRRSSRSPSAEPGPGQGQVRIECCAVGSAARTSTPGTTRRHGRLSARIGLPPVRALDQEVVFGHEFCGEVAEHGPGAAGARPARRSSRCRCCARQRRDRRAVGARPGAYAEQLLVEESLMLPVPNGLAPRRRRADRADGGRLARRAARRGREATVAIVIGCGPIGLGGDPACSRRRACAPWSRATTRRAGARSPPHAGPTS